MACWQQRKYSFWFFLYFFFASSFFFLYDDVHCNDERTCAKKEVTQEPIFDRISIVDKLCVESGAVDTRRCVRVGSYAQHYKLLLNRIGCSNWFDKFANVSTAERLLQQWMSISKHQTQCADTRAATQVQWYRYGWLCVVNIYVLNVKIENRCQSIV